MLEVSQYSHMPSSHPTPQTAVGVQIFAIDLHKVYVLFLVQSSPMAM